MLNCKFIHEFIPVKLGKCENDNNNVKNKYTTKSRQANEHITIHFVKMIRCHCFVIVIWLNILLSFFDEKPVDYVK